MLLFALLAFIPFNQVTETSVIQDVLSSRIPGHDWSLKEIGDGNINYIYLAKSKDRKILIKKALDYARIDPVAFPLPMERLYYEHKAYALYQKICPERIPEIYFYDKRHGILAMQYLTPHIVLRTGLLKGKKYPLLAKHLGTFLARSLYLTSQYHLPEKELKKNRAVFEKNEAMRAIIESLNFTEPFYGSSKNRWTSPELDDLVVEIQENQDIKQKVELLKAKFLTQPEALSHGDLHTGSILVTQTDTRVFDTEFASYAPISFDIGMLLANFSMASIASSAHGTDMFYLSSLAPSTWNSFEKTFRQLWKNQESSADEKLKEIWNDTLQLMGVEIIRRTIGIAHNADFESISNQQEKASIERQALLFAIELINHSELITNSQTLEFYIQSFSSITADVELHETRL
jgi:5-methylthioribose kinase